MAIQINGNGTITGYTPTTISGTLATSNMPAGSILQVQQTVKTDTYASGSLSPHSTASSNALEVSITPSNASNKIYIMVSAHGSSSYWGSVSAGSWQGFLMKGSSVLVQGDASGSRQRMTMRSGDSDSIGVEEPLNFNYLDTAGGTSAITYGIRLHNSDNGSKELFLNRSPDDSDSQTTTTRTVSTITAMEIKA